jgi:hypothetical protein
MARLALPSEFRWIGHHNLLTSHTSTFAYGAT